MSRLREHLPPWLRRAARDIDHHVLRSYPAFYLSSLPRAVWPRRFTDKVRRRMLFDRDPLLQTFADKALVRDYVRSVVGERYLARAYAISDDPRSVDWHALPETYACKATHACGGAVIVSEDADASTTLPAPEGAKWGRFFVRPGSASPERMTAISEHWLGRRFGRGPGSTHEWQYGGITPRILVEELLRGPDGRRVNAEYNFYVFHGVCAIVRAASDRMTKLRLGTYRPDWTRIPVSGSRHEPDEPHERPANLDDMLRVAEALATDIEFVRVDLYDLGDRVVFGELTVTPTAGRPRIPPMLDRLLGEYWHLGRSRSS